MRSFLSLGLFACLLSLPARAEVANPNLLPFGEEEAFLGNAGIANQSSTGAVFYNPGALGFVRDKKVSVYGNAYMGERAYVKAGYDINGSEVPITSGTFQPVPTGSVTMFGNERYSYAFSILVPHQQSYDFQIPYQDSSSFLNYVGSISSSSLWFGPSFAKRDREGFAWGFSAFVQRHSSSRNTIVYIDKPTAPGATGAFGVRRRTVDWSALLVLGAQWRLWSNWILGARIQTQSVDLRGRTDYFGVSQGTIRGQAVSRLDNEQGIHSRHRLPWNLGAGARHVMANGTEILLDLNAQMPIHYQTNPSHPEIGANINTRFRPRANLGVKWRTTEKNNLLFGFLWNPSTLVVDTATSGDLDEENFKGLTIGYQVDSGVLITSVGGFFLWSNGIYRTSDVFGTVTNLSEAEHQFYGLLLSASYRL